MRQNIGGKRLELVIGDITHEETDAIVNAANSALAGGSGVDGAIHRVGGPEIIKETNLRYPDGCPTGQAVISSSGQLSCKYVIHTVGPIWSGGGNDEARLLASAYSQSLKLANEHHCRSVSFPAISCGIYGYPLEQASQLAIQATHDHLLTETSVEEVRFVLFSDEIFRFFETSLQSKTSPSASGFLRRWWRG